MGRYVGTKILHLAVVLLIVSLLTYALLDLMPGGIEYSLFGPDATPQQIALARTQLHLDDPFIVRYGRWLGDAKDFSGDEQLAKVPPAAELRNAKGLLFTPMVGSPDDVAADINAFLANVRTTQLIVCLHLPGLAPELTRRSMELFAREVRPRLKN